MPSQGGAHGFFACLRDREYTISKRDSSKSLVKRAVRCRDDSLAQYSTPSLTSSQTCPQRMSAPPCKFNTWEARDCLTGFVSLDARLQLRSGLTFKSFSFR